MKLYYLANVNNPAQLLAFQEATQMMKKFGLIVYSNVSTKTDFELSEKDNLEQIDAVIVDASSTQAEVGYLLAVAIAHKKPVLYLIPKGSVLDDSVKALLNNKEIKKYLRIEYFFPKTILKKIQEFLQYLDQDMGREAYSVKFTLRLSPRIERYLQWKAEQVNKNKADFVRHELEEMLKKDEEYKNRLK